MDCRTPWKSSTTSFPSSARSSSASAAATGERTRSWKRMTPVSRASVTSRKVTRGLFACVQAIPLDARNDAKRHASMPAEGTTDTSGKSSAAEPVESTLAPVTVFRTDEADVEAAIAVAALMEEPRAAELAGPVLPAAGAADAGEALGTSEPARPWVEARLGGPTEPGPLRAAEPGWRSEAGALRAVPLAQLPRPSRRRTSWRPGAQSLRARNAAQSLPSFRMTCRTPKRA
mmetsp:Transcript_10915/g.42287  ORF Transcript_10915/g.42287 Transcript_10915/m.42287 type:complete len:231 (-) Transcript_10915:1902-2594(-)